MVDPEREKPRNGRQRPWMTPIQQAPARSSRAPGGRPGAGAQPGIDDQPAHHRQGGGDEGQVAEDHLDLRMGRVS